MPGRSAPVSVLITAEHASPGIPAEWAALFQGQEATVRSHRGWDPGSLELATKLAHAFNAPLLAGKASRLLVDLNRSVGHPQHFSEFTRSLPPESRSRIVEDFWRPHWDGYRQRIDQAHGGLVHIACHSFSPILEGQPRRADVGLLYDPSRPREGAFCRTLGQHLQRAWAGLRVRMNYPYRGTANGLGQQHRRLYSGARLLTVELEVNSGLRDQPWWTEFLDLLVHGCLVSLDRV